MPRHCAATWYGESNADAKCRQVLVGEQIAKCMRQRRMTQIASAIKNAKERKSPIKAIKSVLIAAEAFHFQYPAAPYNS